MDDEEHSQRVEAAIKCWDRPTLDGIIEIENHLAAGVSFSDIGISQETYRHMKKEVHLCFGRQLVQKLRLVPCEDDFFKLEDILSDGLVEYADLLTSCKELDRFSDQLARQKIRCG